MVTLRSWSIFISDHVIIFLYIYCEFNRVVEVIFHKRVRVFYQGFQTREDNRIHELFTKRRLLCFRACKTRKTMKTRGRVGRVIFIVLSALQALKNNERRAVNSRVYSIVLMCLETLAKHKPRVYEITSQSFIV